VIAKNANKTITEYLQLLILDLRKTQMCLYPNLRNTIFYQDKLVDAYQGVPACRYTLSNPPKDIGELINKLQSAIIAYKKEKGIDNTQIQPQVYFTNRQYYTENRTNGNRPTYQNRDYHRPSGNRSIHRDRDRPTLHCFICKKEGCRS